MSHDPYELTPARRLVLVLATIVLFAAGVWMPLP